MCTSGNSRCFNSRCLVFKRIAGNMGGKQKQSGKESRPTKKTPVNFRLQFSDLWENPELVFTNMSSSWLAKAGAAIPEFFLRKFPYVQALTLLMLLAERALKVEKYPPMHPYIIYFVAGMCAVAGIMMSFKIQLKHASLLYSIVLTYLAINAYTNKQFNYSKHVRNRISSRHLGCLGVYLIYSIIKSSRESKLLHRLAELCVATYLFTQAYLINESYEDRKAIMDLLPGGNYARYFITLVYGSAGLCFVSGYFLKDISISVAFMLAILTCLVDMRFWFWSYRGMSYWNQVRLVIENVNLMFGFFLFTNHYENMAKEDYKAVQRAHKEQASEDEDEHQKED